MATEAAAAAVVAVVVARVAVVRAAADSARVVEVAWEGLAAPRVESAAVLAAPGLVAGWAARVAVAARAVAAVAARVAAMVVGVAVRAAAARAGFEAAGVAAKVARAGGVETLAAGPSEIAATPRERSRDKSHIGHSHISCNDQSWMQHCTMTGM